MGQLLAALKRMNESLLKTVVEVHTGTDMISTASQEIAKAPLAIRPAARPATNQAASKPRRLAVANGADTNWEEF